MLEHINRLRQNQGFMKYFNNTSWLMGERILRMFVGLFVGIWVARYLGPEQFGLLSYAQSFVFLFTVISTLGLDEIVVRELVNKTSQRNTLLGTAFSLKFIGALLILPLIALSTLATSNNHQTNIIIFIVASAAIFQSFNVIDFYYQSKVLSKYVALANTVTLAVSSIIKIMLVLNHAPLLAFAVMVAFDATILALGLVYFFVIKNKLSPLMWKFDWDLAKSLLKSSWPLILSSLVIAIYMRIDQIMIKEMLDTHAVGQYAAAVKLSEAWYFIPMAISSSIFPSIIKAKQVSEKLYAQYLQSFYTLMTWLAISIALPVTFLSESVVTTLYGNDYKQASEVLMVHIWAGIFVFLGVASGKWLVNENLQIFSFYRSILGVLVNILLNFILIPLYGVVGAAIATLVSQFSAAYLFHLFHHKTRCTFWMQTKAMFSQPHIPTGQT